MDQYYLDTSSILPYYREEPHSPLVQDFLISLSALSRLVRMEEIDDAQAGIIEQAFSRTACRACSNVYPLP